MIGERELTVLRGRIENTMSPYRFRHTAEVERMVARLADLYAPEASLWLRAAALLHDLTKEANFEEQLALCTAHGIVLTEAEKNSPKTLHAITAAAVIPERYPELATAEILSAVRWHTTGRAGMSVEDWLLYLADYIDLSRTFPDCVALRNLFWEAEPERMDRIERLAHLRRVLLRSLNMTIDSLVEEGSTVSPESLEARDWLTDNAL